MILISNLSPNNFNINSIHSFSRSPKNLKHLMYFLCLYHLISNKNKKYNFEKIKIVSLPKKFKKFTLLRAPFRHKLTKKKYSLIKYKTLVLFTINTIEVLKIKNIKDLTSYTNLILKKIY